MGCTHSELSDLALQAPPGAEGLTLLPYFEGERTPDLPHARGSLLEASLEVRHDLTERWGLVGFVDAGAVGSHATPTGADLSTGAGLGVRYDLGFGPIRADIAVPLDKREGDPSFQIYISIGQSF